MDELATLINIAVVLVGVAVAYAVGGSIERRHSRSLALREESLRRIPAVTLRRVPKDWRVEGGELVTGSVVVSLDYFKRFVAFLRMIVGGRVTTYEPVLERARREALIRMKEDAQRKGFDAVFNVRLDTMTIARMGSNGKGTGGVEILAAGTGVKRL